MMRFTYIVVPYMNIHVIADKEFKALSMQKILILIRAIKVLNNRYSIDIHFDMILEVVYDNNSVYKRD